MEDKLTSKEKLEITVQTGLQLVPYVGGALSSAYFTTKQEKRFKRIESFYNELAEKIRQLEIKLAPFDEHDEESLTALIEHLNDKIEKEHSIQKREYFKNFFINALKSPTQVSNYDERRIILEALANMTVLEFQVLLTYLEKHKGKSINVKIDPKIDKDVIAGATVRLEMLGFLESKYVSFGDFLPSRKSINITKFGIKFINFCLE